jgi:hypothetical protein
MYGKAFQHLQSRVFCPVQSWVGTVTQLIPPNYGIVDGEAFYVTPVVVGVPPSVGDRVACEAIPNTDGGMYAWRLIRVEVRLASRTVAGFAHSLSMCLYKTYEDLSCLVQYNVSG